MLQDNVEADNVVLTSDHGNAVGEWRLWGHPTQMPVSTVRAVPWLETMAKDNVTRTPEIEKRQPSEVDVERRLKSLGYRS